MFEAFGDVARRVLAKVEDGVYDEPFPEHDEQDFAPEQDDED